MGLFEKKYCDICGEKIGMLGNRKLDDGNLCKKCAKKLSPWFKERRHSTLEDIREQLAYREANKEKVRAFQVTKEFRGDTKNVYVDERKGQFAIALEMSEEENPDILDLSQVIYARLDIDQREEEEKYRDKEGKMKSYNPPRYKYSYDYWIRVQVNSPWFDDMELRLNTFSVKAGDRIRGAQFENTGNQIVSALQGGMMNQGMQGQRMIQCDKCGWTAMNLTQIPKFCPECGNPIDMNDIL